MISIVVAYDQKFGIGKDGNLPWVIPEDMRHFKNLTTGHVVIMGRKTWDSLPDKFKPLPNRKNIVLTRSLIFGTQNPVYVSSLEEAIDLYSTEEIFIIGGAQVYAEALKKDLVQCVIATEVKGVYDTDVSFPNLKSLGWRGTKTTENDFFSLVEYRK